MKNDQKAKLQTDIDGIKEAFQARQQGQAVDRSKMMALVNDMQQIVDSGVFADADRAKLDGEFKSMQSMQSR